MSDGYTREEYVDNAIALAKGRISQLEEADDLLMARPGVAEIDLAKQVHQACNEHVEVEPVLPDEHPKMRELRARIDELRAALQQTSERIRAAEAIVHQRGGDA
ncbi:MAG: hypothetical protein AAGF92_14615 [Myxococcota bacterium]